MSNPSNQPTRRDFLKQAGVAAGCVAAAANLSSVAGQTVVPPVEPDSTPPKEAPANKVRSVMRLFASDVEDKPWYNNQDFWRRYLAMLADIRFNRFHLAL